MSTPDIKSRPQRIELDYFRHSDPHSRLRWRLACLALFLAGGYACYAMIWGAAAHLNTGPLSMAHAHLERSCAKCHDHPWLVSLASDAWRLAPQSSLEHMESTCQRCHTVAPHFRASLDQEHQAIDRNCTGCHQEHLGPNHQLTLVNDRKCTSCHRDLPAGMVDAASSVRPSIEGFNLESHGEFRSLASDPGRIRFNHSLHLQPGQVAPTRAAAMRLDMLPARWRANYQAPGQELNAAVILKCNDCHQVPGRTDDQLVTADAEVTSAHFLPIRFAQHCAGCHGLNYSGQTADDLPLPHAAPWKELKSILAAKLVGSRLLAESDQTEDLSDATLGSRPDQATERPGRVDEFSINRALQFVQRQCLQCHLAEDITDQSIERLIGQMGSELIPTRWFKYGSFDHAAHRQMDCLTCHHVTDSTPSAQPDNATVMIDGIERCMECHRAVTSVVSSRGHSDAAELGEQARASDRCALCHRYHWTRPSSETQAMDARE